MTSLRFSKVRKSVFRVDLFYLSALKTDYTADVGVQPTR